MKKVAIYESQMFLGGGQKLSLEVAAALRDQYRVTFILPNEEGALLEEVRYQNYNYVKVPVTKTSRGVKSLLDIFRMAALFPYRFTQAFRVLARLKPDVLYVNAAPVFIISTIIGWLLRIDVLWHVHNRFVDGRVVSLLRLVTKFSSLRVIAFDSDALMDQFLGIKKNFVAIYPCIHTDHYAKYEDEDYPLRELGINRDVRVITQISYIGKQKNQLTLLRASAILCKEFDDLIFVFAGDYDEDDEYYLNLKNTILIEDLTEKVFIVGHVEDVRTLLNVSHVNVVVSYEGFSLTIVEAAAMGVPTVAPDEGGPTVIIRNGSNGILYKFDDVGALVRALRSVLVDTNVYDTVSRSLVTISDKYTMTQYHTVVRDVVQEVLEQS